MNTWVALGILLAVIIGVNFAAALVTNGKCPKETYGTGEKQVKYFSSPLCVACWIQKPIIEKVMTEKGNEATLKEYDVDMCREEAAPHYIRGVPAFMVKDKIVYGLQEEETLKEIIR